MSMEAVVEQSLDASHRRSALLQRAIRLLGSLQDDAVSFITDLSGPGSGTDFEPLLGDSLPLPRPQGLRRASNPGLSSRPRLSLAGSSFTPGDPGEQVGEQVVEAALVSTQQRSAAIIKALDVINEFESDLAGLLDVYGDGEGSEGADAAAIAAAAPGGQGDEQLAEEVLRDAVASSAAALRLRERSVDAARMAVQAGQQASEKVRGGAHAGCGRA